MPICVSIFVCIINAVKMKYNTVPLFRKSCFYIDGSVARRMIMHQDKGELEVVTWSQVRDSVMKLKPKFAKAVDELDPSDDYFFIKCKYPFGSSVLKKGVLMLPCGKDGELVPLSSSLVPSKIRDAISYNLGSNPVSMVLKNSFEIYLSLFDRTIPLNGLISPGTIFGAFRVLHPDCSYQPKFLWDMSAGARSMFMLPKISEAKRHMILKRKFDLSSEKPLSLMSHWQIFKELARHPDFIHSWDADILFFSKKWFENLDDKLWSNFYYSLHRLVWGGTELWRNQPIWNLIFSLMLQEYQARPSAYICDTVKYLMHIAIGSQSGFAPAQDNTSGPISGLQQVYERYYEIKGYPPIIMCPSTFTMNSASSLPVYYSLQFPISMEFGKRSSLRTSFISDLHDIRALLIRYSKEILSNKYLTEGTPMHDLFNLVDFDYFHNNVELHTGMRNSREMRLGDSRLITTMDGKIHDNFPDMCSFVKGCIRVSSRKS